MPEPHRIANIGAEAGAAPDVPAVRSVATLWRSLFDTPPAFAWLPDADGAAVAWLAVVLWQTEQDGSDVTGI